MTHEVPAARLDDLFSVRPDEFVAARNARAKAAAAEGDKELATAIRALRRPSLVAWSVNQAARARGDLVEALFSAADDLRDAVGAGIGDSIRTSMRARRTLVDELTDVALEHAATASPNAEHHRDAIARTWEAASSGQVTRDLVAAGHLTAELTPSTALDDLSMSPLVGSGADPPRTPTRTATRAALPRDELALRRAEDALATARHELADAVARANEADQAVAAAERDASAAREARRRAEGRVERAERAVTQRRAR